MRLNLWPDAMSATMEFVPYMDTFLLPGEEARGLVLVCPGGGYAMRAGHEADPVAECFNRMGFHAAVVQYRVSPARFPAPQSDALRAIQLIRQHAVEWRVKPDKVAILGFSAGGHLAASAGTMYDDPAIPTAAGDAADGEKRRPDAMILCYPVITSTPYGHSGSFAELLGNPSPERALLASLSLEHRITPATPPAFLWHTSEDQAVPVENSLLFAAELRRNGVPFALHVFPYGPHGLGLAERDNEFVKVSGYESVGAWAELAGTWLREMEW